MHNHNSYEYYNKSARNDIENIRKVLNDWFDKLPDNEKPELRQRFNKSFSSAFYELFLYNLFLNQGFEIQIHPKVPNTEKRPDFLICKNGQEIYVEAKEAKDESEYERSQKNRLNTVYDTLDKIKSRNFLLHIKSINIKTHDQPRTKELVKEINNELNSLDPDRALISFESGGLDSLPELKINNEQLEIDMSFVPKDRDKRHECEKFIGIYPMNTHVGGTEPSLRKSFEKKCNRYGELDKPFIVAINALGKWFSGEYDAENTIWGSIALSYTDNPNEDKLIRVKDGLFLHNKGPVHRNASAVLITNIMTFNIAVSNYWFGINPFANNTLDTKDFLLGYQYIKDSTIQTNNNMTIAEIFQIESNWLEQ